MCGQGCHDGSCGVVEEVSFCGVDACSFNLFGDVWMCVICV